MAKINRKGYYFTLDVMLAVILLVSVVTLLYKTESYTEPSLPLEIQTKDFLNYLSNTNANTSTNEVIMYIKNEGEKIPDHLNMLDYIIMTNNKPILLPVIIRTQELLGGFTLGPPDVEYQGLIDGFFNNKTKVSIALTEVNTGTPVNIYNGGDTRTDTTRVSLKQFHVYAEANDFDDGAYLLTVEVWQWIKKVWCTLQSQYS